MTVYETERLVVRRWTADQADLDRLTDIYTRDEILRWLPPFTFEAAPAVERWRAMHEADGRFGSWAVQVRETGVAAGTVLFRPIPGGDGEVEVGWHLHPDSWGNGYATEAARGAVERGFAAGLAEVLALVKPDNEASLAVCRRLGMTPLGRTDRFFGLEAEMFRLTAPR
ncbi:RimJ/RimL family protein N-acetyltransferase [Streptosporangium becharense]|uniref:RimJ/RimL family protein N-acetyltransferase n=1 Tax=Streptosporangium becharense TaxID=1816182 RepID=A0A7W9MJV5_9ACTN|nr:GNAT family N-acetyltransferase [Streptosporangium becharense]MBB2915059.1 RimJ/RimL family protein N-acetyltransferase [Streptosporangium becharense]MBB5822869.1 RimJ/RimL family protein N-acetyltransferase [Streptosporangium becharense]